MPRAIAVTAAITAAVCLASPNPVHAFCGFYVAKADTKLFNEASQVVLVRDGDRTVLTMANDYKGDLREFAIVIPVPTVLERGQIHVGDKAVIDHLDAYTAPRLVEYFDDDPCSPPVVYEMMAVPEAATMDGGMAERARSLGVTIEAQYTVGEYDILILSAEQSSGLSTWLVESGYRIPTGAEDVLGGYLKQGLKFFVAKVNLTEHDKMGFSYLRPIQVAYESPRFQLPIRLGMVNADGPQELFVYALTRTGRVETTNYRTVRIPSDTDVPIFVKDEFSRFYKDMFSHQVQKEDMRVVFMEYAWDMNWCDPCAADPLSQEELRDLGVFWVDAKGQPTGSASNVFVTRLHVRYDNAHFPDDLVFQATTDRTNFQGRYILRHPFAGDVDCEAAREYWSGVTQRQKRSAQNLASMTGWELAEIMGKMDIKEPPAEKSWWDSLWGKAP